MENNDRDFWNHYEHCARLVTMLDKSLELIMNYIFQGRCSDTQEWEILFKVINQAVFMKGYLNSNGSNLITIAEDFLAQFQEWHDEIQNKLY